MGEITLQRLMENEEFSLLIDKSNYCLEQIGYTDHGPRHVLHVSKVAAEILEKLDYPPRRVELARMAGYIHDVGNLVCRKDHGASGALLLYPLLAKTGMDMAEVMDIVAAVGSHEEQNGKPVGDISAALIIADKVDAHRARVRLHCYDINDIHDRVNLSIQKTKVEVDPAERTITFAFTMDGTSSVTEYMEIYLSRMLMCEQSAEYLGCTFSLIINGVRVNRHQRAD